MKAREGKAVPAYTYRILKQVSLFVILLLALLNSQAQIVSLETITNEVKREQSDFLAYVNSSHIDSNIKSRLVRFITIESDSIQLRIITDSTVKEDEKIKGIRSLVFVMKALKENLELQQPVIYDIPGALVSYKQFLETMLRNSGYQEVLKPLGQQRSQLLANTFWQCSECGQLNDIATYKRLASAPDYIIQNLEKNTDFSFRDSLLMLAATTNPVKVAEYLQRSRNRTPLSKIIRDHPNKYLQKVVELANHKHASDLLPFTEQLANGEITVEEIVAERSDVNRYFQLLVNALTKSIKATGNIGFSNALQQAVNEKSLYFYVRTINELHEENDNTRFASVKDMRPQDIYYIITSTGDDLYTSSYLGLYNRMMSHFKEQQADSIFQLVGYDRFHKFISLAANYNVLGNFLKSMPVDSAKMIVRRFISGIENDTQTGIEKAMDIADIFPVLAPSAQASEWVVNELRSNLDRVTGEQQYFGAKLYNVLLQIFDLVQKNDPQHPLWKILGDHEKLQVKDLQNEKGEVTELVTFYGDKDGIASYNSFMKLFTDKKVWEITKAEEWLTIRSLIGPPIVIYANFPLDNDKQYDLAAQENLSAWLRSQSIKPSILIHRGHSYHLEHTFKRLQPSIKLVLLGSCGGYNNNLSIANFSPEAQIILSKKVGSKSINDPLINIINGSILKKENLVWTDVWQQMKSTLGKDQNALELFNEYIPPSKNVNLFVLKLFNYKEKESL